MAAHDCTACTTSDGRAVWPHALRAALRPALQPPGRRPRWRAALAWLRGVLLAAALPMAPGLAADGAAGVRELTQAESLPLTVEGQPRGAPAVATALPDAWRDSRPGFGGVLGYRVRFEAPARPPGQALALAVPQVCSTLQVRLNGSHLLGPAQLVPPFDDHCRRPQLVVLPAGLLLAGGNLLELNVGGHEQAAVGSRLRGGQLSALQIGPLEPLAAAHERRMLLQVTLPQALSATLLLTGAFMFVLGFIHRRESHLAYFGVLSVAWSALQWRLWAPGLPLAQAAVELLGCMTLALAAWAAVQFLLRYARQRWRWIDQGLPLQFMLMALSLVLAGTARLHLLATLWQLLLALQVAAAGLWYLRHARGSRGLWLMGPLLAVLALAALVQAAVEWGGADAAWAHAAGLAVPLVLVVVGLRLVQQHGNARQAAELDKALLEQRVKEATAEIERNLRQLTELRIEQVTQAERKRIAADLHDDLGAKLLTIVHTSESDRISTLAREALEEMRLSVRGLTGKPVRLADALGDWRAEVVARLGQAGIDGSWDAPEELPQTLSARAYVQTTRILREATSNIIKHSGASACAVTVTVADGDFQLVVQDNGDGISSEVEGRLDRGHGLASMKNRAKQLQGQCLVESAPGYGTVIRLTVPLDRATTPTGPGDPGR